MVHGKGSIAGKMPGETFEAKFSNLRAAYGFMMTHPGKKLLFMGQDMGQISEWNENESLPWNLLDYDIHSQTREYVKALNKLYRTYPALYQLDDHPDGFQWMDCTSGQDNIVSFVRKTGKPEETLLVVCNFAPVQHDDYQVGVPFHGKYKEIFNSESKAFGGCGVVNPRVKTSKAEECRGRGESIQIQLAPLGVQIYTCTPVEEEKKAAVSKKTETKKTETKKTATAEKAAPAEVKKEKKAGKAAAAKEKKEEKAEKAGAAEAKKEEKAAAPEEKKTEKTVPAQVKKEEKTEKAPAAEKKEEKAGKAPAPEAKKEKRVEKAGAPETKKEDKARKAEEKTKAEGKKKG